MVTNPRVAPELGELFPFKSNFITISGLRMHYLDEYSGSDISTAPVAILLHGNPTWSFYYRDLVKALRDKFRVIVPDFLGMGFSDRPLSASFRAIDRISHMEELVEKLGLEKYSLVMHDWGGSIGSGLAVRHPEKIERMVYLNTTLTETEALPPLIKLAATPFIGKFLTKYSKSFLRFTTHLGVSRKLSKQIKAGYYLPYKTSQARRAIWDFVDDIPFDSSHPSYSVMLDLAERLPLLANKQVQIVWGLQDPCFHREMLSKVVKQFPDAELIEISDAAHLVLEDAKEIAIPAIARFLERGPLDVPDQSYINSDYSNLTRDSKGRTVEDNVLVRDFLAKVSSLGNRPAVIEPLFLADQVRYGHTSFKDLQDRIFKYERGLTELGLVQGDRVLMLVPPGVEFLALTYAVMGRGATPVFVDPGMGRENLMKCIKEIDPQVLIGSPRAQLLRVKKREIMPSLKFHITASDWIYTGGPRLGYLKRFSSKPLPRVEVPSAAFIAFTSGATGKPKGVVYTNQMLSSQLKLLREEFGLESGKKDMPLLPIFSLFSLANGICSVFPNIDPSKPLSLQPERIVRIVNDLEVNYSFGSPTLWNKIAEYVIRSGESLGSLGKIFMAGAPVSDLVRSRVKELLVNNKDTNGQAISKDVYTPYGATEALPVTLCPAVDYPEKIEAAKSDIEELKIQGQFVGRAVSIVDLKVVEILENNNNKVSELPAYRIGEIIVSGPNISLNYYKNPEADIKGKIDFEGKLWHRMGDLGYLDKNGGLYFCGRRAHSVNAPSGMYYSIPTEMIFNELPKVKRSALVDLGEGQEPGVVIEPYPEHFPNSDEQRREFLKELEELGRSNLLTSKIRWYFFHPSFPVDARHNAKIYRDILGVWARQFINARQEAA